MESGDDVRDAIARVERVLVDLAREIALLRHELGARPLEVRALRGDREPAEIERSKSPTVPMRRRGSEPAPTPSAPADSDTLRPPART